MSPEPFSAPTQTAVTAIDSVFQWLVGSSRGSTYVLARWVFLRALGLIYLIAFVSLWVQVKGLIGIRGILPAQEFLQAVRRYYPGSQRFHVVPTVLWLGAGDAALHLVCALGVLGALLLIADVLPGPTLVLLWALYLSLMSVGRDFLSFQWDALLLEAGLLAVLFTSWHLLPGHAGGRLSALALFLLWWLLFRLTFASGLVKLTWGDPTWRGLTALDFHYWTQPLPTWTAWYMHQLPAWSKKLSVIATFVLEIGFPLLIFGTRGTRFVALAGVLAMQGMILATGNYNFFNLLTVALSLLLVDDAAWARVLPQRLVDWASAPAAPAGPTGLAAAPSALGLMLLVASTAKFLDTLTPRRSPAPAIGRAFAWLDPFRSINGYGLFRVMTTSRLEIVVEGSDDGLTWRAYEFKYKPGDVSRRPGFVEPHQPRLDWQMWFAALSTYEDAPWFPAFLGRLLQGSPAVLRLLRHNPFPDHPPKYVRAMLYDYHFTDAVERRATGAWWVREPVGAYSPVVSLTS